MGEKPTGRTVTVMGLLVTTLLAGFSSADLSDVRLEIEVGLEPEPPWVDASNPLVLTPTLVNDGEAVTLSVNPVCEFVLNVYNETGTLVVDGTEGCPDRSTGFDLFAGDKHRFESLTWDMKTNDGSWLPSGAYTVEVMHTTGLSSTHPVSLQTPVDVPEGLVFDVVWQQRTTSDDGAWLGTVSLHNPSADPVSLSGLPPCSFEHRVAGVASLGASCFGEVAALMPGEVMMVDHLVVPRAASVEAVVSTPGQGFLHQHTMTSSDVPDTAPVAELRFSLNTNEASPFGHGDVLVPDLTLHNLLEVDQSLFFTSSCRAEMWVVDDLGEVVFDSRAGKTCQSIDLELALDQATPLSFSLPQWNFFDQEGCRVNPGTYTVVAELPQYAMAVSQTIEYRDVEVNGCNTAQSVIVDARTTWLDAQTLQVQTTLSATASDRYVRMNQPCTYSVNFLDTNDVSVHRFQALCDEYDGRKMLVPSEGEGLHLPSLDIAFLQNGAPILADGFYTMELSLLSSSSNATTPVSLAWPPTFTGEETQSETTDEEAEPTFELVGTWTGLLTESGTCFVLEMDGEMYLLSNARTLASWSPTSAVQGVYTVRDTTPSPACSDFAAPSVEVTDVVMEQPLTVEEDEPAPPVVQEDLVVEATTPPAATLVTVVVTTSLLSLLAVVVATNEGLRLPATVAGLWFLGLIGKTHETTDGRYQRGRLMGYLTANPGCHFRALMSALDMSNGQITHHLRILEAEEHVWRKGDGRLVRYYPLTNQLNPATAEEDLPVPPLSPDPNSLQGKILSLLDQDGDLGQFPTQAELAKRLEKSQQLISHHLRTLQKYGLVERQKMGLMNRYKLTREAIFLLETSDEFGQS